MAKSRNDILWRFLADTKSLDKGNKSAQSGFKATNKATSAFQSTVGLATKAVGALGLALGGREVLQWGMDAVTAANDYEESINAVAVVTGHAADEIAEMGERSAEAFGLTKTELNEAAVAFTAFGEDIDPDKLPNIFEDFATRAADFASVMNIDVKDAMAKFQSGLAGETEPLRKFGINLSAAAVSAHAVEVGIVAAGEAMTDQEKVQARYSLLMEETAKTQGDFAATADSAANKSKILTKRFQNLQIEIGRKLQPVYEDLLDTTENLMPAIEAAAGAVGGFTGDLGTMSRAVAMLTSGDTSYEDMGKQLWDVANTINEKVNPAWWAMNKAGERFGWEIGPQVNDAIDDMSAGLSELGYEDASRGLQDLAYDAWDLSGGLGAAAGNADDLGREIASLPQIPSLADLEAPTSARPGGGSGTALRAAGGPVSAGVPYTVGEAGRETFVPNRAGTVVPGGVGGGGGVTVNLYGFVGDPVALSQQLNDLLELGGRNGG